jgi:hypothetical protein
LTCLQPQSSHAKLSSPCKAGQTKNYSHSKLVLKLNNVAPTSILSSPLTIMTIMMMMNHPLPITVLSVTVMVVGATMNMKTMMMML